MKKLLVSIALCIATSSALASPLLDLREIAVLQTLNDIDRETIMNIEKSLAQVKSERAMYAWVSHRDNLYIRVFQREKRIRQLCEGNTLELCTSPVVNR